MNKKVLVIVNEAPIKTDIIVVHTVKLFQSMLYLVCFNLVLPEEELN